MKLQKNTRAVVAAIMAITLVAPSAAFAGGGHHKGYSSGQNYGHSGKHRGYGHYRGHGGHYGKHVTKHKYKYDNDNDNDGEKLLIGLLVGGLVGYAISDSRNNSSHQEYYAPATTLPREGYSTTQYSVSSGEGTCLQEREYQNKVIIGGRSVDAYGTACLQPDGSWRYGPARLASF